MNVCWPCMLSKMKNIYYDVMPLDRYMTQSPDVDVTSHVDKRAGTFPQSVRDSYSTNKLTLMAEMGRKDPRPSLCNVNMFCTVQCSHRVWNQNSSPCPAMCLSHKRTSNGIINFE